MSAENAAPADWLSVQARKNAGEWEKSIDLFYPQHSETWRNPDSQWKALQEDWNTWAAMKLVDWSACLPAPGAKVLDLGAGTGWLSAFLSAQANVARIDTLDSGVHNLTVMLPAMIRKAGGDASKIKPILGLFSPILAEDGSYDLLVASSALHHAPNLASVLRECARVMTDDARLVILNETPLTRGQYLRLAVKIFARFTLNVMGGKPADHAASISEDGILYDPYLGDRSYMLTQWTDALRKAGFDFIVMRTPFASYKADRPGAPRLTHFICRKAGAA